MQKLTLPKSGQSMTEGTLLEWHADVGDPVSEGDPVLDFETDKMVSEIVANQDGVLLEREVEAGETIPVGTVLGHVGSEGETPSDGDATEADATDAGADESDGSAADAGTPAEPTPEPTPEMAALSTDEPAAETPEGVVRATPTARREAREAGVEIDAVAAAFDTNQVTPSHVEQHLRRGSANDPTTRPDTDRTDEDILGSPWARVVASENDVTVQRVGEYLGKDRIRERDVRKFLDASVATEEASAEAADPSASTTESPTEAEVEAEIAPSVREEIQITGGEKVMLDQMSHVAQNYASTTTAARVDVTDLLDLYGSLKPTWVEEQGDSLSLTAFVARAVAQALPDYARLNAEYLEDENALRTYDDVNLGIAVNSDDGLIVPTIRHADRQSVRELSRSIETVAEKVEERQLSPEDLEGATFSISNAGSLGAYINTPQINPPQTAILGVCKIFDDAGVVDGEVVPRKRMHLCLTYDHRVIEGATAVEFLQTVKSRLESPSSLLS